jgi:hypothetical protein
LSHFISILLLGSERFRRRHEIGAHRGSSWLHAEKSGTLGFMGCLQNSLLKQYWLYFVWSQIAATRLPSQRRTALDGYGIAMLMPSGGLAEIIVYEALVFAKSVS